MAGEICLQPRIPGIPMQNTELSGVGSYNSSVNSEKLFCDDP